VTGALPAAAPQSAPVRVPTGDMACRPLGSVRRDAGVGGCTEGLPPGSPGIWAGPQAAPNTPISALLTMMADGGADAVPVVPHR